MQIGGNTTACHNWSFTFMMRRKSWRGVKKKKETEKEKKKASFGSLNYEDEAFMEKVQA